MSQATSHTRPPLWRDLRVLRVVGQIVFMIVVVVTLQQMYLNADFQLRSRGRELGFDFLDQRAGFGIKEHLITYSPNANQLRAFLVGFSNSLYLGILGIIGCTVLGVVIGVGRLSPNWLLRKITQFYVEIFRNIPALVQVIFWWSAVFLAIPTIDEALSFFDVAYVSNRAVAIPAVRGDAGFGVWIACTLGALAVAAVVWILRSRYNDRTGQPSYRTSLFLLTFLTISTVVFFVLGGPFHFEAPVPQRFNFAGGIHFSPEFAAGLFGLTIYTAAFVAEIVRGSIMAVSKGQKEAAGSLGLSPRQQLRFVVLPQAMRIALPPITNQYLNLWKNTSILFAIAYPELINVTQTMINQAGNELQIFGMLVLGYLFISLVISGLMNMLNRSVAYKGARS
jgi:general L-amino acid transport system permease protein